ncbi:MAG TPA: exosortase/archaeosortase family protein [Bryobacteraceae bacterium]|nr:exosortase/archaeosortase family protein [Bryobacteraceae bacterium]
MLTREKLQSEPQDQPAPPSHFPWGSMIWFGALLIVCYAPVLKLLVHQWATDDDMGHGFFVPLVAGWIVWTKRPALLAIPLQPNYWGLLVILWGMIQMLLGSIGAELLLARTAFVISLIGVVLTVCGTRTVRELAFPLFLLLFMIPIPQIVYGEVTLPLQLFASTVASNTLNLIGIPSLRTGNILELPNGKQLSVVEACSGIRSLLSLSFISLVYAWFFDAKRWMRLALLIATVPIAILANAARVTITGIISASRPDLAEGFFHSLEGWVLFLFALVLLILCHKVINRVYRLVAVRKAENVGA